MKPCTWVCVAAAIVCCLVPRIAQPSAQGRCSVQAVVASEPRASKQGIGFDAVVIGGVSGYCHVKKKDVIEVRLDPDRCTKQADKAKAGSTESWGTTGLSGSSGLRTNAKPSRRSCKVHRAALKSLEKRRIVSLNGRCGDDALAGSSCGGWKLVGVARAGVDGADSRGGSPMSKAEIDQLIDRALATRGQQCTVMGAVASEPKVSAREIQFEAVAFGDFSGICSVRKKESIEVRLHRAPCAGSIGEKGDESAARCEPSRLDDESFRAAKKLVAEGRAVPLVGRCGQGAPLSGSWCRDWGVHPEALDDDSESGPSIPSPAKAQEILEERRKLAAYEVTIGESKLGDDDQVASRIERTLLNSIRRCTKPAFRKTAVTEGTLSVAFDITQKGRVSAPAIEQSDFSQEIDSCVLRMMKRTRLPRGQEFRARVELRISVPKKGADAGKQ